APWALRRSSPRTTRQATTSSTRRSTRPEGPPSRRKGGQRGGERTMASATSCPNRISTSRGTRRSGQRGREVLLVSGRATGDERDRVLRDARALRRSGKFRRIDVHRSRREGSADQPWLCELADELRRPSPPAGPDHARSGRP